MTDKEWIHLHKIGVYREPQYLDEEVVTWGACTRCGETIYAPEIGIYRGGSWRYYHYRCAPDR